MDQINSIHYIGQWGRVYLPNKSVIRRIYAQGKSNMRQLKPCCPVHPYHYTNLF